LDPVNSGLNRRFLPLLPCQSDHLERRLEKKICLRGDFARPLLNDGMSGRSVQRGTMDPRSVAFSGGSPRLDLRSVIA
jgi:hypothetical protein